MLHQPNDSTVKTEFVVSPNPKSGTLKVSRLFARVLGIAGLMAITLPSAPAQANDYAACATQLRNADLSPEVVADACAKVLHPQDLGNCVVNIQRNTIVPVGDALAACVRVRRPLDLATCVLEINRETIATKNLEQDSNKTAVMTALDTCHRSLLPIQFSHCVVGLSRRIDLTPVGAMGTCIDANDRPRDVLPSFMPAQG